MVLDANEALLRINAIIDENFEASISKFSALQQIAYILQELEDSFDRQLKAAKSVDMQEPWEIGEE